MNCRFLATVVVPLLATPALAATPALLGSHQAKEVIIPPSITQAAAHVRPNGEWIIPPAGGKPNAGRTGLSAHGIKPDEWIIPPAIAKAPDTGRTARSGQGIKPDGEWIIPPA